MAKPRWVVVVLLLVLALGLGISPARAQSGPRVDVATVDGPIVTVVYDYLNRAISTAEQDGATALVVQLNTPGGDVAATLRIIQRFAVQIAKQEWRSDLSGLDLGPLVKAVVEQPGMAQQIHENMDASAQAAFSAKTTLDQEASAKSKPVDPSDLVGDVKD